MCELNGQLILSSSKNAMITRCGSCGTYNVIYKNIHLVFDQREMIEFKHTLVSLESEDFNKPYWKEKRVLLKNNRCSFGISLTEKEADELLNVFQEAEMYEEVFSILY